MKMYDSTNCLVNLSNSILKRFHAPTYHETIKEVDELLAKKKKVVLFLFDAMGKNVIEANAKQTGNLRSHVFKEITSTFAPTTVAATNALLSGKYPTENGWFSWSQYFKSLNQNINVFMNCDSQTFEKVDDFNYKEIAKYKNIATLINEANHKIMAAALFQNPIQLGSYNTICEMMTHVEQMIRKFDDEAFVYAYHTEPDHTCHSKGITSRPVKHYLRQINKWLVKFARRNPDVTVLAVADHGHINVEPCILEEHPDFVDTLLRPFSFEVRSANFFVKPDRKEEFERLFKKYYGQYFELYTQQEVIDKEFYGPKNMSEDYKSFFGDYLAVSISNRYFANTKKDAFFKGHHAGGTKEEMELYLMCFDGQKQ